MGAICIMPTTPCPWIRQSATLSLAIIAAAPLHAQLVAYDGFGDYAAGAQVESGANSSSGVGLDGGAGWGGPYNISNAIKSLVRIENRSTSPVNFPNGEISISGGNRALTAAFALALAVPPLLAFLLAAMLGRPRWR